MPSDHPELGREHDLTNLRDYYLPGSDEAEISATPEQLAKVPLEHEQHRYEKDLGPLGKAEILHGKVTDGKEKGKQYETWRLPGELAVELPELGNVTLTNMRTGLNREADTTETLWGDGEFSGADLGALEYASLPWEASNRKNTEQVELGAGRVVYREHTNPDAEGEEPAYHYYETRHYDAAATVIATVELPAMGGDPGGERPLVATTFRLKRIEANRDPSEGAQGRAKFIVTVEQPEPAAS